MKCLQEILDKKNYLKLVHAYGGSRIWVPKIGNLGHRNQSYYANRNDEIRYSRKQGKSIKKLAEMYGLSCKRIYNIINEEDRRNS